MKTKTASLALVFTFLVLAAHSQPFSINWYKVAGGGGASAGGTYQVNGTVGQPDASGMMTGGGYSLTGGFWSLISVVQTPGAPLLTISSSGNRVIVSWPSSISGWILQTNSNLGATNWVNYSGPIVNNTVTNSPMNGNLFFRLTQP